MMLVQIPECGGFDLNFADKLRKSIAKKNPAAFLELQDQYFKEIKEKGLSQNLCNYVWNVLVSTSKGYGFNASHTLAYSLVGLQEMNLAYRYPSIFWSCACLISDSGGAENEQEDEDDLIDTAEHIEYFNEMEDFNDEEDEAEDSYDEDEDCDGFPAEVIVTKAGKKKKKAKATNYGKIATAIGKIQSEGIRVFTPDINKSSFTFSPDADNDIIRYGLSGITRIGDDLIKTIIANRPYTSVDDFISKVKINKTQMINLIKSGAFDYLGDRQEVMSKYLLSVADQKKRITLQNMQMLIAKNLLPSELDYEKAVFNFNKYLKKNKYGIYYILDEIASRFYDKHYNCDLTSYADGHRVIEQTVWDKIYKKEMNPARDYLKANSAQLLTDLNRILFEEVRDKYCIGNISRWEMDSISFYYHPHELSSVDESRYNIGAFDKMSENAPVEYFANIKGKQVPIYKLTRIAGTVLDKNKTKGTVTLLTCHGVVQVKIYKNQFALYDRQLSMKMPDGKKKVIEKSWFSRGNKLIITGIRRGSDFIPKKYRNTPYPLIGLITDIDETTGEIIYKTEREEV